MKYSNIKLCRPMLESLLPDKVTQADKLIHLGCFGFKSVGLEFGGIASFLQLT